jgi:hypothetical protein
MMETCNLIQRPVAPEISAFILYSTVNTTALHFNSRKDATKHMKI